MDRKTEEEKLYGYEKELGIRNVPKSLDPYISAVYGNQKAIDRLLKIKVDIHSRNEINRLVEVAIIHAIASGVQKQREENHKEMVEMRKRLDHYEMQDRKEKKMYKIVKIAN